MDSKPELKREDQLTDLSKIPSSELPQDKSHGLFGRVSETLQHGLDKVKGLVSSNKENLQAKAEEKVDEKKAEVKEVINEWEQPLGHANRPHAEPAAENKAASTESHSLGEKLKTSIGGLSSTISHQVDTLKERFKHKEQEGTDKENLPESSESKQGGQSLVGKLKDGYELIANKLSRNPEKNEEAEGFHKVHDGFSETVDELKHEQGKDVEYVSANPFEPLEGEATTEEAKKGLVSKIGGDITNKVQQLKEGISDATSKISGKYTETKEKLKSSITSGDKENAINVDKEMSQIS